MYNIKWWVFFVNLPLDFDSTMGSLMQAMKVQMRMFIGLTIGVADSYVLRYWVPIVACAFSFALNQVNNGRTKKVS